MTRGRVSHLTLYSRPGCHLCDEMKAVVRQVARRIPLTFEEVDITGDLRLERDYGVDIPVLLIDGRKVAKHRLTEMELERKLKGGRDERG